MTRDYLVCKYDMYSTEKYREYLRQALAQIDSLGRDKEKIHDLIDSTEEKLYRLMSNAADSMEEGDYNEKGHIWTQLRHIDEWETEENG